MLLLSKVFMYNWHRFHRVVLDVHDSLYFTGVNGSGKSTILDALQVVLIADLNRIAFNYSAQERSTRSLDSYVRGKLGENRWLRPGKTIGFVVLEFTNSDKPIEKTVFGIAIEAAPERSPERLHFILSEPLDDNLFFSPSGQPLTRRELRKLLNTRRGARLFDNVSDYNNEMLVRLGGLNEKMFPDLFMRAFKFQPIANITEFVKHWLLQERRLDVAALKSVQARLRDLELHRRQVVEKLANLDRIAEKQKQAQQAQHLHDAHLVLTTLLTRASEERALADRAERERQRTRQVGEGRKELGDLDAAWQGARHALEDIRFQLRQSDVIQRRDTLMREIQTMQGQVARLREVWTTLRADLMRTAQGLSPLTESSDLEENEKQALQTWITAVDELPQQPLPLENFGETMHSALAALEAGMERVRGQKVRLDVRMDDLLERERNESREIDRLHQRQITYPHEVERLRDLIAAELGKPPLLVCENIEVTDDHWQNAVEALLGRNRFALVVPNDQFEESLRILEQARISQQAFGVRLLDLEKVEREARNAQPGSLAEKVRTNDPRLRAYIDSVLGDVMTASSRQELRAHRRAVTPEVIYYSGWAVEAIHPRNYQPWYIGTRAQLSQIGMREQALEEIRGQQRQVEQSLASVRQRLGQFGRLQELTRLGHRLEVPLDERPLTAQIEQDQAALAELDLSGIQALQAQADRLEESAQEISARRDALNQNVGKWENDLENLREEQARIKRRIEELEAQEADQRNRFASAVPQAEQMAAEQNKTAEAEEAIRRAAEAASSYEAKANAAFRAYTQEASSYNTRYRFAGDPSNVDETRYLQEQERLNATELPNYKEKIQAAQLEADEELREHVLHRLRENVQQAKSDLTKINAALEGISFNGETYRFVYRVSDGTRGFYDLIQGSQFLGTGTLKESQFYRDHQAEYDQFYRLLIRDAATEAERAEQDMLSDYRNYLDYDIVVTHVDGSQSNWSKIMGQSSGGESQTPFYLTIAASFAQLYHINEPSRRPSMRLVIFDEAFAKMDQGRSTAAMDIFQRFGLQVITASPLNHASDIVPHVATTYVITSINSHAIVEPYRVYMESLAEKEKEQVAMAEAAEEVG